MVKAKSASPCSSQIWDYKFYALNYILYMFYINSKRASKIATPKCTHQESSPSTAEFWRIWVSTCGLGGCGRVGCSGGIVAEGAGVFAVIWASVGGMGYAPGCTVGTVSYLGSPSGTESLSMGLSAGFCLLGHFRGPIPSAWGVYSGRWVVAGGRWAVLWAFS